MIICQSFSKKVVQNSVVLFKIHLHARSIGATAATGQRYGKPDQKVFSKAKKASTKEIGRAHLSYS